MIVVRVFMSISCATVFLNARMAVMKKGVRSVSVLVIIGSVRIRSSASRQHISVMEIVTAVMGATNGIVKILLQLLCD